MPNYQNFDDSYKFMQEFYNDLQNEISLLRRLNNSKDRYMILEINNKPHIINSDSDFRSALIEEEVPDSLVEEILSSKFQLFEKTLFKDPDFIENEKYWQILLTIVEL